MENFVLHLMRINDAMRTYMDRYIAAHIDCFKIDDDLYNFVLSAFFSCCFTYLKYTAHTTENETAEKKSLLL